MKKYALLFMTTGILALTCIGCGGKNLSEYPETSISSTPSLTSIVSTDNVEPTVTEEYKWEPTPTLDPKNDPSHVCYHSPTEIRPTCTEGGYTIYTCVCGDSYIGNETPSLHSYSSHCILREDGPQPTCYMCPTELINSLKEAGYFPEDLYTESFEVAGKKITLEAKLVVFCRYSKLTFLYSDKDVQKLLQEIYGEDYEEVIQDIPEKELSQAVKKKCIELLDEKNDPYPYERD